MIIIIFLYLSLLCYIFALYFLNIEFEKKIKEIDVIYFNKLMEVMESGKKSNMFTNFRNL